MALSFLGSSSQSSHTKLHWGGENELDNEVEQLPYQFFCGEFSIHDDWDKFLSQKLLCQQQ